MRALFDHHVDFVWRSARRLGLTNAEAEDAVQQVFMVATRKIHEIDPNKERSYLLSTTYRVAANARRSRARKREDEMDRAVNATNNEGPEGALERAQGFEIVQRILDQLEEDIRDVFVLYELEEMTMAEISTLLDLAPGTVASRLRRAREKFHELAARYRNEGDA